MSYSFNNLKNLISSLNKTSRPNNLSAIQKNGAVLPMQSTSDYSAAIIQKSNQHKGQFYFGLDKWGDLTKTIGE